MQTGLKSISKIFSESIFRIPDYQRGYSWEEKHLKDFLNDIEQLPIGKSHYTGVLTFEPVPKSIYYTWYDDVWIIDSKRYVPLYVVDGQQRLTTAIVLMQAILESVTDNTLLNYTTKQEIKKKYIFDSKDGGISRSYIFGYEKDNPSYEYLKQYIFGEQSENHSTSENTIYTKNLERAKKYFLDRLKDKDITDIESVFTKLTQNLQFNIFYIEPELDVFVTFETMNNRGKALSHLELLKNRLIYLSTRFEVEQVEKDLLRKCVNESWKTIYHYLGKISSKKGDDNIFLLSHFFFYYAKKIIKNEIKEDDDSRYIFHRYIRGEHLYKDRLLESIFTPKRLLSEKEQLTLSEVYEYAKDIKSFVATYYQILEPENSNWSDKEKIKLCQIKRLDEYPLLMLAIAAMKKVSASDERERLLYTIEKLGFFCQIRSYYFSDLQVENLVLKLLSDEIHAADVINKLVQATNKFVKDKDFVESLFNIGKGRGYYGWGALRYFMYEYEQHLRVHSKSERNLLSWEQYQSESYAVDHKTIEHIYPQKAEDKYWKSKFENYSVKQRNILKNSLGNLLPVSHAKNASLSNKSFQEKKGNQANQVGYSYGCLSEIQVAFAQDWGAAQILCRGIMLLNFMEKNWDIKIGTDLEKVRYLGLDFVLDIEKASLEQIIKNNSLVSPNDFNL